MRGSSSRMLAAVVLATLLAGGCARGPALLPADQQVTIDRKFVEYPAGFDLKPYITGLTAPTAIAFDADRSILIAEGGFSGEEPRIFGFKQDGTFFQIYPTGKRILGGLIKTGDLIYGPVGGMVVEQGKIYVSHRDENDRGVISAFDYDGNKTTVVADLPAQGDYGVTDLAVHPNGRLYFGVGTATNSGVVGMDNWQRGWVKKHPDVADVPFIDVKLLGYRFDTPNPKGGILGGDDIAVTAPLQPFGTSNQTRIAKAANGKPNGAIYSINPNGGDLRVEAHGIRYPRGLAFNEYGRLYVSNNGMELRGTRPVKDDPDALLRVVPGTWYGWPDFSADLRPISDWRFQPPPQMIIKTGYPDLAFLIDHDTSSLLRPDRNTLLQATFPSLSGAAKMDFAPGSGPFRDFRGSAVIALSGDRAPFATSGQELRQPVGYKVMLVDVDTRQVKEFIRNTAGLPASRQSDGDGNGAIQALERPVDVKFGPDGAMYLLDLGQLEMKQGKEKVAPRTGRVYKLIDIPAPATEPQGNEG